ncbi:MAG: WYL domain-containing transcriptional regulator [Acidobacteriota bacterium]
MGRASGRTAVERDSRRGFARLLALARMLCGHRSWRLSELAEEFRVQRSTIWRNLRSLCEAGFPVVNGRYGWKMMSATALPVSFTVEELLSLYTAASAPALNAGTPLAEPLKAAMHKIESLASPEVTKVARRAKDRVQLRVSSQSDYKAVREVFRRLERAVYDARYVEAYYQALGEKKARKYVLAPLGLFFRRHAWYAAAIPSDCERALTFKLIRFKRVSELDRTFVPPPGFSVDAHLSRAWELFDGEPVDVTVKFAARLVPLIKEQQRHATQRVEDLPGGAALLHVQVPLAPDFIAWLLGFGPEVEVLHPPELRARMLETARAMAKTYGNGGSRDA